MATITATESSFYTLAFWKAYKAAGYRHVKFVGILGSADIPGIITRVTTVNVFVRIDGTVQPMHPNDLRPANPNAVAGMRRQGLI